MTDSSRLPTLLRGDLPADIASEYGAAGKIAWDVETTGLDWRQDRLAVCQLFSPSVGVSIIQVGDTIPTHLAALVSDSGVEKVFHHAPFDLKFMTNRWGVHSESVRCTKVASKLLTPSAPNTEHSLAPLVAKHLGVALDKGPVRRSNWESANLSPAQLRYAANDVLHLIPLLEALEDGLADAGLLGLYNTCCGFLPTRVQLELLNVPDVFAY